MANLPVPITLHDCPWTRRTLGSLREFLLHVRQRWYLYLALSLIWTLAYLRLFFVTTPLVPVMFNWTPSLPYHVALLRPSTHSPARGDYVVFHFEGEATSRYPGLRHQPLFKQVAGIPGDEVTVADRHIYVNGRYAGTAKPRTFDGWPLAPIQPTTIPDNHYFVSGSSPDSFASRYAASGLVRADRIIFRVEPLF
jgi:conjugal transfer pilin signal peptidase TrbI